MVMKTSCEMDRRRDSRCLIRGPGLLPGEKQDWQHVGKATMLVLCRGNQQRLGMRQKLSEPD